MHHRLIVLTDVFKRETKKKGIEKLSKKFKNGFDVSEYVQNYLENEGFSAQQRFASGPADWFSMGGRWSGELAIHQLNPLVWQSFMDDPKFPAGLSGKNEKTEIRKIEKLFKIYFPKAKMMCPAVRPFLNSYSITGESAYEGDAQIVSPKLWNRLIKKLVAEAQDDYYEDGILTIEDNSIEELKKEDVIGKKWAVVVDYHT